MTEPLLAYNPETARPLLEEVRERSGQDIYACYQCRRCAAGCPVGDATGFLTPDRLIRMISLGDREGALNNQLIWKCTSCFTCGTRCPNDIQTSRITETLKKIAKEVHAEPLQPKVAYFHHAFIKSSLRWGRVNEMEFMGWYEFKITLKFLKKLRFKEIYNEIINQAKLGLAMLKLGRMHFKFQSAKGRKEIKTLFKKHKKRIEG